LQDLQRNGVDTNLHDDKEAGHTGRCLVFVTPDADRTMATYLGITGELSRQQLVPEALKASDYLYIEGYLVTSDAARNLSVEARQMAAQAGVKTAFSLSDPNMVTYFKEGLMEMMGAGVDLLFANESEAMGMAGTAVLAEAIDKMKHLSRQFVITQGPRGALLWDGKRIIEVPGQAVTAVDTVGAGDMFAGAFLYGVTQGWDFAKAGELATKASAELVTRFGPRMTREQSQSLLTTLA
jgi:sugar/nucleoside kinase (ribokinase family)